MIKGIGTDIIDIKRIKKMIDNDTRFKQRVFSEAEITYAENKARKEQNYAARFAAKEAFFKALGTGWRDGMSWTDISVENDRLGKPEIRLSGKALETFITREFTSIHLTLSHTRSYAVAFVVLE